MKIKRWNVGMINDVKKKEIKATLSVSLYFAVWVCAYILSYWQNCILLPPPIYGILHWLQCVCIYIWYSRALSTLGVEIPQETALKSALRHLKEENMVGLGIQLFCCIQFDVLSDWRIMILSIYVMQYFP